MKAEFKRFGWRSGGTALAIMLFAVSYAIRVNVPVRAGGVARYQDAAISVRSEIGGRILNIYFRDGAEIKAGAPFLQLDTGPLLRKKSALESRIHATELRSPGGNAAGLSALYRDLEDTRLQLARMTITSPATGRLRLAGSLAAGGMITAGTPVATVFPSAYNLVIEAWLTAYDRSFVRSGQRVRLRGNGFPSEQYGSFDGSVLSIEWYSSVSPSAPYRILVLPFPYSPSVTPGQTFEVGFLIKREERLLFAILKTLGALASQRA